MAYVDDPNKKQNQNTMNVLQPIADGTQPPQGGQQPSPTPVSGGQGGAIQTAPSPRQQQKPASSGTFTNLQQYSQANKGGAQRITQAATQNVAQQGKQVQQQVGQQAAKTQSDIEANQAKIAKEQEFARKQLERAGTAIGREDIESYERSVLGENYDKFKEQEAEIQGRVRPMDFGPGSANEQAGIRNQQDLEALREQYKLDYLYNPSEDDFNRFRNIVTGQTQFNDVRDLDLSQQRVQAQQLQQLGQQAGTDQGRLALLMQTLGRGKEYTRGQSGLDAALIARDAEARQALQQGIQQTAEQATGALQSTQSDISSRRQALQALNTSFGSGIMTEGETATTSVLDDVEDGRVSLADARAQLAEELGITEAEAEERMDQMASERDALNAARQRNENSGYTYGGALGYAGRGMDLSREQEEALALAGVDPKLAMTEDEKAYYEANRSGTAKRNSRFGTRSGSFRFDRSGGYIWDQGGLGYGLDANINRMLGGEASALRAGVGSEALARQLAMSGGDQELYRSLFGGDDVGDANALYASLKAGEDINTQTAASVEQARRYNALQDLLRGRDGVGASGERTLSLDQAGKAAEQEALLRQARAEAMRKFKIQGE
jgi:ABC-type transporter MlaC component